MKKILKFILNFLKWTTYLWLVELFKLLKKLICKKSSGGSNGNKK